MPPTVHGALAREGIAWHLAAACSWVGRRRCDRHALSCSHRTSAAPGDFAQRQAAASRAQAPAGTCHRSDTRFLPRVSILRLGAQTAVQGGGGSAESSRQMGTPACSAACACACVGRQHRALAHQQQPGWCRGYKPHAAWVSVAPALAEHGGMRDGLSQGAARACAPPDSHSLLRQLPGFAGQHQSEPPAVVVNVHAWVQHIARHVGAHCAGSRRQAVLRSCTGWPRSLHACRAPDLHSTSTPTGPPARSSVADAPVPAAVG